MISLIRRLAQSIRHHEAVQFLEPLWLALRKPYLGIMNVLGRRHGFTVTIAGCRIRLHPAFCTQNWETVEASAYSAFASAVMPGMVIMDVGAHIGTYTIIALIKSGPKGRVVAYEPHGYTWQYLLRHLEWNDVANRAVVRNVCCGRSGGLEDFYYVSDQAEGMNGLVPVVGFRKTRAVVVSIDDEVASLRLTPDIIKIDVEGAEWDVLKGAEQLLIRKCPLLFLSLHPDALVKRKESPEQVLAWLEQRGFTCKVIAKDHEVHVLARAAVTSGSTYSGS